MKNAFVFFGLLFCNFVYTQQTAHQFSVPRIEGGITSLSAYSGKKILVITLPVSQSLQADSLLYSLDTLSAARTASLQVVAVTSLEDGYTDLVKPQLLAWYRSKLGSHVLITDGLLTKKSSGSGQHLLFRWMTNADQNEVFDIDAEAPGYKYFINESGILYGVLRPQSKMWGTSVQKTLNGQ